MRNWYQDCRFILHYDHQYSPSDSPPPVSGLDRDQVERLLRRVRPDAVQYLARGSHGYVPYATRFGNRQMAIPDDETRDPLTLFREVTRELDIRFVIGYSGLIDHRSASWRPDWLRMAASFSPYPNRGICPNSGYVDELMLPQLDEILERFSPDGIWIDHESWTVSPCYCSACESEYQMLHERSAPMERSDPMWPEWLQFHRDSFYRYVTRVARFLHDRNADLVYASVGAYATHQPEAVPTGPDRLTRDLSPAYSLLQAGLEARFFDSRGLPFDLSTWNRCSPRPWGAARVPAYLKSFEHLAQEGAVVMAGGGAWSVWVTTGPDDSLPEGEHAVVEQAAEFARARRELTGDTRCAAYAAILHSDAAHRRAGNGLYDPGPCLDRVRGAHQALLELHHPHAVVSESGLPAALDRCRLLLLPEQVALPPELDGQIEAWVRAGGRLVASGRVSPRLIEDVPTFALEELLGVRWTGRQEDGAWLQFRGLPLRLPGPFYPVALHGAATMVPSLGSGHERIQREREWPGVTRQAVGLGEVFYLAADFFAAYHRCQYPGLRELLGEVLEAALPHPPLLTGAPPTLEITLRERGRDTIVHFVNHAPGKSLAQNSAFIESVPPTAPFSLTLALPGRPESVSLHPGDAAVDWSFSQGTLTVFVPPVQIHAALVIRAPAPEPEEFAPAAPAEVAPQAVGPQDAGPQDAGD